MDCLFCDIANGKKSGYIIYQNESTMAFLDIYPVSPGHLMVIPLKHGQTLLDFSKQEVGDVFETVQRMIRILEKTFFTKSFTIGVNHGEFGGVGHLHVHIIPRSNKDGGGIIQSIVHKGTTDNLAEILTKIKKNL